MLAWEQYKKTLCPGCDLPIDEAWHPMQDGWFEVREVGECAACHAKALHQWREDGSKDNPPAPVVYTTVVDTRDHQADPLPPRPPYRPSTFITQPGQE